MYIIAIETTGAYASVALADTSKGDKPEVLAYVQGNDRFSHLQNLTPQIQEVISKSSLSINDIGAIAVSNGPGSFTGIRIGVSTARALAQILGIPCIAVSSLEALAMHGAAIEEAEADTLMCPILDARRSQVYGGGYVLEDGYPVEKVKAGPYTIEEFLDAIKDYGKVIFLGDGVNACGAKIEAGRAQPYGFADEEIRYQTADSVAVLGAKLFDEGKSCSYGELDPEYMRIAEAERKLKEEQAAKAKARG